MIINNFRIYEKDFTKGLLYINGEFFCYSLEHVSRADNVKIKNYTCIPEGKYKVSISFSNRFKKHMLVIHNAKNQTIEKNGIYFSGIRPHGGNDINDSNGCPLIAFNRSPKGEKVWNRSSDKLLEKVKLAIANNENIFWVVSS